MGTGDPAIAKRLREARIAAGYDSAAEAADHRGVPIPTYDAHENGGHAISLKKAVQYAEFFDVNLAWLAEGKLPMKGQGDTTDILDGLPPEARQQAIEYIAFLKSKYGV